MEISVKAIALLNILEGCKLTAYQDTRGIWTIGYGTIKYQSGTPVKKGDKMTHEEAQFMRNEYLKAQAIALAPHITNKKTTQQQFDALNIFAYNLGEPATAASTLMKLHNKGDYVGAEAQFLMWGNERGKDGKLNHSPSLYARRKTEAQVYTKGIYTKIEVTKT